jgi:pyruvate/2-oxoglutarate dehydrogenase complex dihydrolipoamide acyltransferase (E2) component
MSAGHGLIVPVLKSVEKMDFEELVVAYEALKKRALESKLSSSDMKEATVSLTNFGTLGGLCGTPIIPYSQTAIVGLGRIDKEPVVVDDKIAIHRRQMVCCSFDHRIIDGAGAARFISAFIKTL